MMSRFAVGVVAFAGSVLFLPLSAHAQRRPAPPDIAAVKSLKTLGIRYVLAGVHSFADADACPSGVNKNGSEVLTAELRYLGRSSDGFHRYEGKGRYKVDIDHCEATRDFVLSGEPDWVCSMRVATDFSVDVELAIEMLDGAVNGFEIRSRATTRDRPVQVTGNCPGEGAKEALVKRYRNQSEPFILSDTELMRTIAPAGRPRTGTYQDPERGDLRWTLAVVAIDEDPPSCEPDSVMLENAREQAGVAARDAQASLLALRALLTVLSSDPVAAEVGAFLSSQQDEMTSAVAARGAARDPAARDAANAAYGVALTALMAGQDANAARLSVAGIPAGGNAPRDPRFVQLSTLMSQFGLQAQALQRWLGDVERYRQRYAECSGP